MLHEVRKFLKQIFPNAFLRFLTLFSKHNDLCHWLIVHSNGWIQLEIIFKFNKNQRQSLQFENFFEYDTLFKNYTISYWSTNNWTTFVNSVFILNCNHLQTSYTRIYFDITNKLRHIQNHTSLQSISTFCGFTNTVTENSFYVFYVCFKKS